MASTNPVPSRAAINALRGVILTTSCSVILLAEERRRRIQIARAAIDNARKLHTVRVNHGPALSEAFGRREAWGPELGEELPPLPIAPQTKGPIRRRRRNGERRGDLDLAKSIELETPVEKTQTVSNTPESRRKAWDEWEVARKEMTRLSASSPFAHNDLFLRMSTDDETPIPPLTQQELDARKELGKAPKKAVTSATTRDPDTRTDISDAACDTLPTSVTSETLSRNGPGADLPGSAIDGGNGELVTRDSVEENLPTEATTPATATLLSPDSQPKEYQLEQEAKYSRLLASFDVLLAELQTPPVHQEDVSKQISSAIMLLERLTTGNFRPKTLVPRVLQLLKSTVEMDQHDRIPAILDASLPANSDGLTVLVPFFEFLQESHDLEGVRQLLNHSSRMLFLTSQPVDEAPPFWIVSFLNDNWKTNKNIDRIKQVYSVFQDGGLFSGTGIPAVIQFAIRRSIALIALNAGDDAMAAVELEHILTLRPEAVNTDVELKAKFVIRDAVAGRWESVIEDLAVLKDIQGSTDSHYQKTLERLTRVYAKEHRPEEVEVFVRDLVHTYEMSLNISLALLVMDKHGRNRDISSLVQWIDFCQGAGLGMDQAFFDNVAKRCSMYWNFDRRRICGLFKTLRASLPWLEEPRLLSYSHDGALGALHKRSSKQQDGIPVPALRKPMGMSLAKFEQNTFKCLNSRALEENWEEVIQVYKEASEMGLGPSPRCLRLAVVANIKEDEGGTKRAARLVRQAHAEGHDVNSALVPLLIADIEAGGDAKNMIEATIHKGARVHDSVYNMACVSLANTRRLPTVVTICKIAAKENGNGDPAYNQYNFANWISACTRLGWYKDLEMLVSSFTSKSAYWQGSKECKESVKRAMKRVAMKAETDSRRKQDHEEALICLDRAFKHIKDRRATVNEERWKLTEGLAELCKPTHSHREIEGAQRRQPLRVASGSDSKSVAQAAAEPTATKSGEIVSRQQTQPTISKDILGASMMRASSSPFHQEEEPVDCRIESQGPIGMAAAFG